MNRGMGHRHIAMLGPGDEERLDAFLLKHEDSTMFLRANMLAYGIGEGNLPRQGLYVALIQGDTIEGVVAHTGHGIVIIQASVSAGALARRAVRASGRAVQGFCGPIAHVARVREALGFSHVSTVRDTREDLFAIRVDQLVVPPKLASAAVICETANLDHLGLLTRWQQAYQSETTPAAEPPTPEAVEASLRAQAAAGTLFVLRADTALVAMCCFTATTPQAVQFGGVWTPPALRGRGYARAVVAGALLLAARRDGVVKGVLFTPRDNFPAQRSYRACGFVLVGDYSLVRLRAVG